MGLKKEEILRINRWLKNKPMPPFQLELRPTQKCNLKCLTCKTMGKAKYDKNEEIPFKVYKKIIKEAAEINIKTIHITGGGEPLTSETTIPIMTYIKKLGMEGTLATNGILFKEGGIKELVKVGWDNIAFSIDAPDEKTNDYIKGQKNAFKKSTDNIRLFNYYKKKLKKKKKPVIELRPVLNSYNYNKLIEYIKLAHSLEVKEVYVQPLRVRFKEFGKELILSKKQQDYFKNSIKEVWKMSSKLGIKINLKSFDDLLIEKNSNIKEVIKSYTNNDNKNINNPEKQSKSDKPKVDFSYLPCYNPWSFMSIKPSGDMYPCSAEMPANFGNTKIDRLKETWVGKKFNLLRKQFTKNKDTLPVFGNIKTNSLKEVWFGKKFNLLRKQFINKNIPDCCNLCCGLNLLKTKNIQKKIE